MHTAMKKWLCGSLAFLLPALVAFVGELLDQSRFRHDPLYTAVIPFVSWGALLLSVIIPLALVITARMTLPRRLSATAIVLSGLLLEFYLIIIWVLMNAH